jgi:D-sedoheptulose 7-phosphate isomerase
MCCVRKRNFVAVASCSSLSARTPQEYYAAHQQIVENLPYEEMDSAIKELVSAYERGANVFTCGNGGSAALASHFACDLGKGTLIGKNDRKPFRVISLADNVPLMTAWANDEGYEHVFAEQLRSLVLSGDLVFAISGSGNSPNIIRALALAKDYGARTVGLTGFEGGKMKELCDVCVIVPSEHMQVIEDFHLSATHAMSSVIRQRISDGAGFHRAKIAVMAD